MITDEHVNKFKSRNRIFYDFEDERLRHDLEMSYEDIQAKCGQFEMDESSLGRELVFERTRYVLNDKLEEFHNNFLSSIVQFQILNMEVSDDGAIT
ncbi:hypothetical protein BUZ31_05220 [Staphylococcus haemolyticus]|uniref:Uncharacterized protein n=1 Tax=Staphylococcus devriesei TaxID=586733 RepID=A0A2K4DHC1_9STAP|nr:MULTISPECIES: hypothetical protein [Staphylococcus]MCE4993210.1 hypothetical protein [Staphylococcus haemolyticus]MCE5089224.1 hypothetical protein [Staphylococcus devriesei]MCE5096526.1 hypothetical protein [Staphylococcus devriesei]MWF62665.1 hypothetical protein [Staphylococcus haemolyticus]PNZ86255.1 hypothetical protein CD147_10270 [Staphylococcus devriesei]